MTYFKAEFEKRTLDFVADTSGEAVSHARHIESDPQMKSGKLLDLRRYYPYANTYRRVNIK